ncbi:hypothetical protein BC332_25993 [Capsicum chinense]|nr:hypothetical protein BC332_25993 [Capsicum chinense]
MTNNPLPLSMDHSDEEDYIDIEVSSYSYFSSSPNSSFQIASITNNKESTTSPAGKLLPLHQKLLQLFEEEDLEESFCINLLITPIGSPSQSCKLSFELNPNDQNSFEWSNTELTTSSHNISPKKLCKHSLISHKLKASKAFLKSLFTKSSCTNDNSYSSKNMKFSRTRNTTKWHSPTDYLSSSSTNSSSTGGSVSSSNSSFNSDYELNFHKRSRSFTSETEGSIEAAVAHCKKSLDLTIPTNNSSVATLRTLKITTKIAVQGQVNLLELSKSIIDQSFPIVVFLNVELPCYVIHAPERMVEWSIRIAKGFAFESKLNHLELGF